MNSRSTKDKEKMEGDPIAFAIRFATGCEGS